MKITARSLMSIDWKIWEKHNWSHGGEVNHAVHDADLVKELTKRGVKRGEVNPHIYLVLEDQNYHTLNEALVRLGYYPPFEYSELR